MTPYVEINQLFSRPEAGEFYGEEVTIAQHMLQAAALADAEGASKELVVSALLHDLGHLTQGVGDDIRNRDHPALAMSVLERLFEPAVSEPVRLHVAAKRYLVATESTYFNQLSPASVATLELQGGAMSAEECEAFLTNQYAGAALAVRVWDEAAKETGIEVPPLAHYQPLIEALT